MCPICLSFVASTEREVLLHLLAAHPMASLGLTTILALSNVALAKRPVMLVLLDLGVYLAAVAIARQSPPPGYPR